MSHSGCDVSLPFTTSKKRSCSRFVIGPTVPSPMVRLSTSRTGVISAAVPVKKHLVGEVELVARDAAPRATSRPSSRASVRTVSRVMPSRIDAESGGVRSMPLLHDEEVLARALAHVAVRVEEDGLVVAAELRLALGEHAVRVLAHDLALGEARR